MMKPFFTVIIPVYNRVNLLKLTLESLKRQTFENYEAFIIDDGSTDGTKEIFGKYSDEKRWKFLVMEKNKGQAHCRNVAIKQSSGRFITFLDADDLWLPYRLERFYEKISKNEKAGFIFSNGYILRDGSITGTFFKQTRKIPSGKLPAYMAISDYWLPYVTTNIAFAREVLDKTGLFREDMSHLEDMELYTKILRYCETDFIPEPLSVYRIHSLTKNPASLTLKWDKGIEDFLIAVDTASPSEKVKKELEEYVYYKQALVYMKNLQPEKAREYLKKVMDIRPSAKIIFAYMVSFLPKFIMLGLRFVYKITRRLRFSIISGDKFSDIKSWIKGIEDAAKN
ncbi:MAG: UDP-Glc:alpha-D-GlcNAc-diphosphoundecaprenol beta-1,3-glucosyltransferase WfgD [Elusimicrobia bacterium ADurb.Bin231]|nr:MAG: UDP-Glc:alpha-D-GlcNAc-diphosphoundecaprenol beta-1,3-glucosyltransferase WfgD [Elusimicrobia bacterium ADurb.Bin231]